MFASRFSGNVSLVAAASLVAALAGSQTAIGALGDCSQPVSTGENPVPSDCLFILRVAVNLQACTPKPCVCDVNGDGGTSPTDALACLRKAVGMPTMLDCPCDTTTTSTTTTSTTTTTVFVSDCINDGNCSSDDCVCSDCDDDLFCGNPDNCNDNGICHTFTEGCVCADCATHPECLDN